MAEPIEQLIVDNLLGALRQCSVNGVEEGRIPIDARQRELPWIFVGIEETGRIDGSVRHVQIDLGADVTVVFASDSEPDALRMARKARAEVEAAVMRDSKRGRLNPITTVETHTIGESGDGLWAVSVPVKITFQHVRGNPYDEGV